MAIGGTTVLAVIPARGGSKGIPRKNLRQIQGKSLIAHAAAALESLDWIDHAVLTTDDEEIAAEGRRCGLDVPFLRPAHLARDESDAVSTWQHAWRTSESHYGMRFDVSVLVQPTTPTRTSEDIELTVRELIAKKADAVATVNRLPGHYTPEKILRIDDSGHLRPYLSHGLSCTSRQMAPSYYYRNGIAYAVTRAHLLDHGQLMEGNCVPLLIEHDIANIDDPIELDWAEFLLNRHSL
jgi:CMP-N-acetylneuraminic acid synthetase